MPPRHRGAALGNDRARGLKTASGSPALMVPGAFAMRALRAESVAGVAFLAPWLLPALALPAPWRGLAVALTLALGALLLAAGAWSRLRAEELGLEGSDWAFAAVVTCGLAMLVLLLRREHVRWGPETLCFECGRMNALAADFCHGCGALS